MAKREFLMLAETFDKARDCIAGWWYSEKLDGVRCFWDGGLTRGKPKSEVPWANVEKDARYVDTQVATGLWSRYGHVIHAPDTWLDSLPKMPLDGELWNGRGEGKRQELMTIIKSLVPGPGWQRVQFMCFGIPPLATVFEDGKITNTNFKKVFKGIEAWIAAQSFTFSYLATPWQRFEGAYHILGQQCVGPVAYRHQQYELPFSTTLAEKKLEAELEKVCERDGEGLIVRDPNSTWVHERSKKLLKLKKLQDAEGIAVGCTAGRETDKGSKLLGKMGALILDINGKRLELSGFTDEERELDATGQDWASKNPGKECPSEIMPKAFPRGTIVTFRYRELSSDGIPVEARYWRKA